MVAGNGITNECPQCLGAHLQYRNSPSGERDGGRSSSTALRWAWCRVIVVDGRRPALLWFAVRSRGSPPCRVVVVGGRRPALLSFAVRSCGSPPCRVLVVGGRRPALLWFAVRSCDSRCTDLVVGGRRSFDGVGRDEVGQRRGLEGKGHTEFLGQTKMRKGQHVSFSLSQQQHINTQKKSMWH